MYLITYRAMILLKHALSYYFKSYIKVIESFEWKRSSGSLSSTSSAWHFKAVQIALGCESTSLAGNFTDIVFIIWPAVFSTTSVRSDFSSWFTGGYLMEGEEMFIVYLGMRQLYCFFTLVQYFPHFRFLHWGPISGKDWLQGQWRWFCWCDLLAHSSWRICCPHIM